MERRKKKKKKQKNHLLGYDSTVMLFISSVCRFPSFLLKGNSVPVCTLPFIIFYSFIYTQDNVIHKYSYRVLNTV